MKIIFISPQVNPFMTTGGLGDYVDGLTNSLSSNSNINIKVIMPFYKNINLKFYKKIGEFNIKNSNIDSKISYFTFFFKKIKNIEYFFISNDYCFNHENVYGYDDVFRFTFFLKATLDLIDEMSWEVDILHLNDSFTALTPILLKYNDYKWSAKTLLTIHNLLYQSELNDEIKKNISCFFESKYYIKENSCLENGIKYSDCITTVSSNYAKEITTTELGYNLKDLLNEKKVIGICNGLNYKRHPKISNDFKCFLEKKKKEKANIQKKYGLEINNKPLMTYISRLCEEKGTELLYDNIEEIIKDNQLILLGVGDKKYENKFKKINKKYSNFKAIIEFNSKIAEELYRASDIFLMPSSFEPCGTSQLIALNHGTIPIVHNTGGLKDTIIDCFKNSEHGNGFKFYDFNSDEFYDTILNAVDIFKNKKEFWIKIMENDYKEDYGWDNQVKIYLKYYKSLLE